MNLNLPENKINEIIDSSINKILKEYHAEQRLPFDDDFYGKKNQLEQYIDWLEDFGKYGKLPSSSLKFNEEVEKIINILKSKKSSFKYITNLNYRYIVPKINKFSKYLCRNINFDENGNVYVERLIRLQFKPEDTNHNLYDELKNKYQNNIGGCWSYMIGGSDSYGGEGYNFLKLIGKVRVDDIDFLNTVYLNVFYNEEHEIRVKPNAVIALEKIQYGKYNHVFSPTLLSKASYFGTNKTYLGDFARIRNSFENTEMYMDRQNNVFDDNGVSDRLESLIASGKSIADVFDSITPIKFGISIVWVRSVGYNYYDKKNNKILCKKWFSNKEKAKKLWNKIIYSYLKINTR